MISQDDSKSIEFSNMFNYAIGNCPIKYLGVPVVGSRLHVADWLSIVEKLMKRLDGWKGSALSLGGRLTLIHSCLSNLPIYTMLMYWFPMSPLEKCSSGKGEA
jgi:hypothetical protein